MKFSQGTRKSQLKHGILACFQEPAHRVRSRLEVFTERDWRGVLCWLDMSGLALYVLDRVKLLGVDDCLPRSIIARLQQNLADNRERTSSLFDETVRLSSTLKQANIQFALLKGITLCPESVSEISLRCQMDIDLLIRNKDAFATRDILLGFGYAMSLIKGKEWGFTAGCETPLKMERLYQTRPQKMVEVHLLSALGAGGGGSFGDQLERARLRPFQGVDLPALCAADQFVQQALHVFRHLCSEHTRAQWVLEYWRHVETRRNDASFWRDVETIASQERHGETAIGAITLLATLLFGTSVLPSLLEQTLESLPRGVRLWIELYGRRVLVTDFPASKFYLFLRPQLEGGRLVPRPFRWRFLLPLHWRPARITRGAPGEPMRTRWMRYRVELGGALRRLGFHLRTSLPFAIESFRWQRMMAERGR